MSTCALTTAWDLYVDGNGNLASLSDVQASTAQDVASAIRTYLGECWYDTTLGMPYLQSILGQRPTSAFLKTQIRNAALTVPGVTAVNVVSLQLVNRQLTGQVLVTTSTGSAPIRVIL